MSRNTNQTVYIGLAVTAAALVAGYLLYASNTEPAAGKGGKDTSNLSQPKSPVRSTKKESMETTTPVASNISKGKGSSSSTSASDKAIHAKIEELDKAGKKLFKEKKVRERIEACCTVKRFGGLLILLWLVF